jgi:hypothetical protein
MSMRKKKLNDDDQAAVDLLLDRPTEGFYMGSLADTGVFVKSVAVQPERIRTVKQVLNLLKEMPVAEPPADLAGKTLRKVYASKQVDSSAILRTGSNQRGTDRQSLS